MQFFQYISLQTFKHKYSLLCHTYLIGAFPLQNGTKITPQVDNWLYLTRRQRTSNYKLFKIILRLITFDYFNNAYFLLIKHIRSVKPKFTLIEIIQGTYMIYPILYSEHH